MPLLKINLFCKEWSQFGGQRWAQPSNRQRFGRRKAEGGGRKGGRACTSLINPFREELSVSIASEGVIFPCTFQLFSLQGQWIHNTTLREAVNVLPIGDLPAGSYFYRVLDANGVSVGGDKLHCE
jgi:hypothetical protein